MLESLFNKVAGLKTLLGRDSQHRRHEKQTSEAVVHKYSSKLVLLKILQISQEITCVGVSFQGSTLTVKSPYVITYTCPNFSVRDVRGQIPKQISCVIPFT